MMSRRKGASAMKRESGYFEDVIQILDRWRHLGVRTVSNGTHHTHSAGRVVGIPA
jgi:hypothetical protein